MSHPIVHVELATNDPQADARFYSEVFGWNIHHDAQFDYTMFQTPSGPGGGAFPRADGQWNNDGDVIIYIGTDDIEATMAKIEAAGGKAQGEKMEVTGNGWLQFFSDPAGHRRALWKQIQQGGETPPG